MKSPYDAFEVDDRAASEGVWLDYGSFRIRIARAWQNNHGFTRLLDASMKPYRRLLENGTMDQEVLKSVMADVYSKRIILSCEYKDKDGKTWKAGIIGKDGKVLPSDPEHVKKLLLDLPDLFDDIVNQSKSLELFKRDIAEVEAKN